MMRYGREGKCALLNGLVVRILSAFPPLVIACWMYWANVIGGHIKVAHIADLNCVVVLTYLCLVLPFFLVLEVDVLIGKE